MKNFLTRKECVVCSHEKFNELETFHDFPVYMGTTKQEQEEDLFCDLIFMKCEHCGTVQLKNLIPLDILYANSHANVVGPTWKRHHHEFCKFVSKYTEGEVIEIGGSNLMVANELSKNNKITNIKVFDKKIHYEKKESSKILPFEEFFTPEHISVDTNCVIHTHLIEHLYTPTKTLRDIGEKLQNGAYMMFAAPQIDNMLKSGFTNAMNFEHSYLLCDKKVRYMVEQAGFQVIEEKDFSEYAKFYICQKKQNAKQTVAMNFDDEKTINQFIYNNKTEAVRIAKNLKNEKKDNSFIFGAHIFTQFLLKFGLKEDSFSAILDNDLKKVNNRLYGTKLLTETPKILKNYKEPIVVLKAAQYTEEIKKDILENINSKTRFIT
jgi:hypothetical protein